MTNEYAQAMASRDTARTTELRGDCPKWVVNVLDAVSMAGGETRTALVNQILGDWAKAKVHEASLIHKVAGINPQGAESVGVDQ